MVSADFNGDGWIDIYVANDQMANQCWINQRDGRFKNEALLGGSAFNQEGEPRPAWEWTQRILTPTVMRICS